MSEWNKVVAQTWNKNKHLAGYMFKDALKDAKKIYKKGGVIGGDKKKYIVEVEEHEKVQEVHATTPASTPPTQGGKSRKVRKERKERKDRKTRKRNH